MDSRQAHHFYEFGPFRLDVTEQLLLRDGTVIPITPKAFETLIALVEQSGHLVAKEELMKRLWPDTFVEEVNLAHNISLLRRALSQNEDEKYIQTVPRRGYRFLAPVKELEDVNSIESERPAIPTIAQGETDSPAPPVGRRHVWIAAMLALIVVTAAFVYLRQRHWNLATAQPPINPLAVLPLENRSGDASQDYFADGMTEELSSELSKIGSLRVISRSSTIQYKGARKSLSEIARELNVDAIVVGSVWRSGDKVRINTQLYRASTDQNVWANSYERDLRDILSLQGEVARGIAGEIKIKLTLQEQASLSQAHSINSQAQDAYLRGLEYFNQAANSRTERKKWFEKSAASYQQAITIEPGYARAYAALADAFALLGFVTGSLEYYPKAKEAALTAIRLDESDAGAHAALAGVLWTHDWNATGAEKEYQRAMELGPNTSRGGIALWDYAFFLASLGRHEEAIREIRMAEERDPLNLALKTNVGNIYFNARQYDRALEKFKSLGELHPDFFAGGFALARIYAYQGRHEEAIAEMEKVTVRGQGNATNNLDLAWVYAMAGRRSEATKILDELKKQPLQSTPNGTNLKVAQVYAALSDQEQAFIWLAKSFTARERGLRWLKTDPYWDEMRPDARFQEMLRRRGFPA